MAPPKDPPSADLLRRIIDAVRAAGIRRTARRLGWSVSTLHRRLTAPGTLTFAELCELADDAGLSVSLSITSTSASVPLQSPAELPFTPPI